MLFGTIIIGLAFFIAFTAYKMIDAKKKAALNGDHNTTKKPSEEPSSSNNSNTTNGSWMDKQFNKNSTNNTSQKKRNYGDVEYVEGELQKDIAGSSDTGKRTAYY